MGKMPGYQIISDVGDALIKLLREGMVPDIIQNTEGIGMCHPSDRGDVNLGILLYDIKRNTDIVSVNRTAVGNDKLRSPSMFLDLYFMITAYSASDIKFRSLEEAKILGRTLQIFEGTPLLRGELFGSPFSGLQYPPKIELLELEAEEKTRIWGISDPPYKLSLFYKVYPVEIESEKIRTVTRVKETDITIGQIRNG